MKLTKLILFLLFCGIVPLSANNDPSNPDATREEATTDTVAIPKLWTFNGSTSLHFTQVSFTNWNSGGDDSYSLTSLIDLKLNYHKDKWRWENSLTIGYGFSNNEDDGYRKTDDRLDLSSLLAKQVSDVWYFTFLNVFRTQFSNGYDYDDEPKTLMSAFLSPGYWESSLGYGYRSKKGNLILNYSPLAYKLTVLRDEFLSEVGGFGVEPGESSKHEFGTTFYLNYTEENLIHNIDLTTKLNLFSNYTEDFGNVDINWEVLLALKVNKYVSAHISTLLIYDNDIKREADNVEVGGAQIQFKELVSVGFQYSF